MRLFRFSGAGGSGVFYATLVGDPFRAGGSPPASNPGITCPTSVRKRTNWYNPCAFGNPLPGSQLGSGTVTGAAATPYLGGVRNEVYGPGYERINLSLFKNFRIHEAIALQFRADIFNVLNNVRFMNPGVTLTAASTFGGITSAYDPRIIQLAMKFVF